MSVQTEIDRIIHAVESAHAKVAEKGGTTTRPYLVGNLASAIDTIPEATEPTLQSKTVSPSTSAQTVKPDSGYDGLSQVTVNAMSTATQATPSISVSSAGLITASATQTAGYVEAGTKSATKQLTTQGAQTITPGTSNKTISSGQYLTGTQTIKGDANLIADNIKQGISIFGVAGKLAAGGLPDGVSKLATGTITPSESVTYLDISHGLGVAPNFLVWRLERDTSGSVLTSTATTGSCISKLSKYTSSSSTVYTVTHHWGGYDSSGKFIKGDGAIYANSTDMTASVARMRSNSTYYIKGGYTYRWLCGVLDGIS